MIGSFAESATYVRQRWVTSGADGEELELRYDVGTGELTPDAAFAPHGHVVVVTVALTKS